MEKTGTDKTNYFHFTPVDGNNVLLVLGEKTYLFHAPTLRTFKIDSIAERNVRNYNKNSLSSNRHFRKQNIDNREHYPLKELEEAGIFPKVDPGLLVSKSNSLKGKSLRIRCLTLNLAHKCNLSCNYCYANQGNYNTKKRSHFMSYETARKAVDYFLSIAEPGSAGIAIDFSGGEPLLNYDVLQRAITYIYGKTKHCRGKVLVNVVTNGLLLTAEKIEFLKNRNAHIAVSIDGDEQIHDANRVTPKGDGSYRRIIGNIENEVKKSPDVFSVRSTITPSGSDVLRICNHLDFLGFREYTFDIVFGDNKKISNSWNNSSIAEYDRNYGVYTEAIMKRLLTGERIQLSFLLDRLYRIHKRVPLTRACRMAASLLVVTPDGDFYPCYRLTELEAFRVGSVYDGMDKNRQEALFPKQVFERERCKTCWARYLCGGGCPAPSFMRLGEDKEPDTWLCKSRQIVWKWSLWLYIKLRETKFPLESIF